MKNLLPLITLLSSMSLFATENSECTGDVLSKYIEYQADLKQGNETGMHWDIKGMASLMEETGIPNSEHAERLTSYITALDSLHFNIEKVLRVWGDCSGANSHGIIEIVPPDQEITGKYISIRIKENGKIMNISFENDITGFGVDQSELTMISSDKQLIIKLL